MEYSQCDCSATSTGPSNRNNAYMSLCGRIRNVVVRQVGQDAEDRSIPKVPHASTHLIKSIEDFTAFNTLKEQEHRDDTPMTMIPSVLSSDHSATFY